MTPRIHFSVLLLALFAVLQLVSATDGVRNYKSHGLFSVRIET